jgi:hypothetical protein
MWKANSIACLAGLSLTALLWIGGCNDNSPSVEERQRAALRDPFGYKQDFGDQPKAANPGSDDKEETKKESHHALNP